MRVEKEGLQPFSCMMDEINKGYSQRYKVIEKDSFEVYGEEFVYEKSALSSLYGNFLLDDRRKAEKIANLYSKINYCGQNEVELLNHYTGDQLRFPSYCNNRACSEPDCMKHRGYLFNKEHNEQISKIDANIRAPKGWVFTGWKIPLNKLDRKFCQKKLILVNNLCQMFSVSAYSVHMEIKIYAKFKKNGKYNKNDWMAYLHFHVVSGGFRKLGVMRKKYGRHIENQDAIKKQNLNFYMSKYASKTPYFDSEFKRQYYHLLVYKLQMHRFSVKKDKSLETRESEWMLVDEIRNCLMRDSYKNPLSEKRRYFQFLEDNPPPNGGCLDDWT